MINYIQKRWEQYNSDGDYIIITPSDLGGIPLKIGYISELSGRDNPITITIGGNEQTFITTQGQFELACDNITNIKIKNKIDNTNAKVEWVLDCIIEE